VVAFTFGLLHGFGFGGARAEVGLPPATIPIALPFFTVGVGIGQFARSPSDGQGRVIVVCRPPMTRVRRSVFAGDAPHDRRPTIR
jgi:hypothetical protein